MGTPSPPPTGPLKMGLQKLSKIEIFKNHNIAKNETYFIPEIILDIPWNFQPNRTKIVGGMMKNVTRSVVTRYKSTNFRPLRFGLLWPWPWPWMTSDAWIARDKDQAFQNGFVFSNPSITLVSRSISSRGGRFAPPCPFHAPFGGCPL